MQILKIRTIGFVLVLLLAVGLLAGCGGGAIAKPTPPAGEETVNITGECSLARSGDELIVTGETNLHSDAIIYVSIHSQDGIELDSKTINNPDDGKISETFTITDKYDDSVSIIYAFISCAPRRYGAQSDGVLRLYGDKFEYINNPVVPILDEDGHNMYIVTKTGELLDVDENGDPILEDTSMSMDDVTKLERSTFQWNSEGLIVTFASGPEDM